MMPWLEHHDAHANPTASHRRGRRARQALDDARAIIADSVGCGRGDVVFTGGGTESDNVAVGRGRPPGALVVGATEHPAVLEPAQRQGAKVAPVNDAGIVDADTVEPLLDDTTELVSVMTVNNETGVIQPIREIAEVVRRRTNALVHTDAVQALPWLDLAVHAPADLLSVTGHKLGGPQGVGALVIRNGSDVEPLLVGGGQERDRRAGTQNVAGIVGFAAAVQASADDRAERLARIDALATALLDGVTEAISGVERTVSRDVRVPGIIHLTIDGVQSEPLLFLLDDADLACSAASSCASGAQGASHVLSAMGLDTANCAPLRLSLGWSTTEAEIDEAIQTLTQAVTTLRERAAVHG